MPSGKLKKCAHPACDCPVEGEDKYCSTYCHDAGNTVEISCNCGHPGCAVTEDVPVGGALVGGEA